MSEVKQVLKFDAERKKDFAQDLMSDPGCEKLHQCIQCGTCSAYCPFSAFMDFTPRRLIQLTRAGFKKEVLSSQTIWLCTACYGCTAECPKEIKITDIMYALKRRALAEGVQPRKFPVPIMVKEFYRMAGREGRVNENMLASIMMGKLVMAGKTPQLGMAKVGLGLWKSGRALPWQVIKSEHIEQKPQLMRLLAAVGVGARKGAASR